MRWLIGLAGVLAIGAAAAPRPIATGRFVEWQSTDGPRAYRAGDVTVRIAATDKDGNAPPAIIVAAPGIAPLRIVNDDAVAHYPSSIGIGPLARGAAPSVVIQTYSGGAHCCTHVAVALREGKAFRLVDLGGDWNGDAIAWPTDLSGDGAADFRFVDNAFFYAFGSYADSWAPPLVTTIRGGRAVDVSAEPAFRPLFAADIVKARKACLAAEPSFAGGPCAGYLADAARLGRFDAAWAEVARTGRTAQAGFPDACDEQPRPDPCYRDFATGVRAFLRERGYRR